MHSSQDKPHRLPPRRLLLGGAYVITAITVLLLCLPLLVAQGMRYNLLQFGAGAVEVDNVDLNLFSGHLAIDGMRIYRSAAEVFSLGHAELVIDWSSLFQRRLRLNRVSISRLAITLDEPDPSTLRIAGLAFPPPAPAPPRPAEGAQSEPWGIGLDELTIDHARFQLIRPGLATSLTINQAKLDNTLSWEAAQPSRFTLSASFEQARLDLRGQATPFASEPTASGTLQLDSFPLASLRPLLPAEYASLQGQLSSTLTLQLQQAPQQQRLNYEGQIRLRGLAIENRTLKLRNEQLTWQGKGNLGFLAGKMHLGITGQVDNTKLALHTPDIELNNIHLGWQGESRLESKGKSLSLTLTGKAQNKGLQLILTSQGLRVSNETLLWEGSAALTALDRPETLKSDSHLQLTALEASPQEGKPFAALATADISTISLSGLHDLSIGDVALSGLAANIRRTSRGIVFLPSGGAPPAQKTAAKTPADTEQPETLPLRWQLDKISLAGNNHINFRDETVKPAFQQRLRISKATISSLDSGNPEQASPFAVTLKQGKYGSLEASGTVQPFRDEPGVTLNSRIRNIEVPPLSPYLAQLLGYKANSGQLDNKLELNIERNEMKGVSRITLKQLELAPEDPARIENFEKKLSLPLNTALSLLRDRDNNIQLKIPISGKLDDPKFDLTDAINTALGKAMRMAAVNYLKNLLQPYGTLISVVQLAGSVGGGIQLDPLRFEPGSAEPLGEMQPYLERLGEMLKSRDDLNLRLCGKATLADLNVLSQGKEKTIPAAGHPALEALAQQRGENIKTILVEGYGIDAGRLFVCHPELDRSEAGIPRLELQL